MQIRAGKTELRSVKAMTQLLLEAPKQSEDQLPVAADGGILDVHIFAFLSAIDSLLTAGRSNAPTEILTPLNAAINAVTAITDDLKAFAQDRSDMDRDALGSLHTQADVTLSNLVAASITHAASSGMSPVSLLDAAASHVSASVTEIGKAIDIRKATMVEHEEFFRTVKPPSTTISIPSYSPSPPLRKVGEVPFHKRKASTPSIHAAESPLTTSSRLAQSSTSPQL